MKIEDISAEYEADVVIDRTDLTESLGNNIKLHAKYCRYYTIENKQLRIYKYQMISLEHAKWLYYIEGPSNETKDLGWPIIRGKIIKSDVDRYIRVDPDIMNLQALIDIAQEKVNILTEYLKGINARGFSIQNMMNQDRFYAGGR